MTVATDTTRIWVASLSDYNNGVLHGEWIGLDGIDIDELWDKVKAMLARSKEPYAEEWAIHDFEGFGSIRLGENESFERLLVWAAGIAEHGDPYAAWVTDVLGRDYGSSASDYDPDTFERQYQGEYDDVAEYAQEAFEQTTSLKAVEEIAGNILDYVDWDRYGDDYATDLTVVEVGSKVWIFDPSA